MMLLVARMFGGIVAPPSMNSAHAMETEAQSSAVAAPFGVVVGVAHRGVGLRLDCAQRRGHGRSWRCGSAVSDEVALKLR